MLARLNEADGPVPMRPVLLCALLYAPFGLVRELPSGGLYVGELTAVGYLYLLVAYIVSTTWCARRVDGPALRPVTRFAVAAAFIGAFAATIVTLAADLAGLEYVYPAPGRMNFRIAECYACEAPWDAAGRAVWYHFRLVILAGLLAPPVAAVSGGYRGRVPTPAV